jgi:S-methylmethionine-dependent homocysteine/selenocysteine methylase
MARYRTALPQLDGSLFLTDGGIETTLIFHEGLELPDFAAFHLLKSEAGRAALRRYFQTYADLAERFGAGLILESATWRASRDWAAKLGYDAAALAEANREAVAMLEEIRDAFERSGRKAVISGAIGPRGDGYQPDRLMSEAEAEDYHGEQIGTFARTAADMVCAITMNYAEEAVGIARAARKAGIPVALSFTVETDGNLPTGQTLEDAIAQVERATAGHPSYYGINCAHPDHFAPALAKGGDVVSRIRGVRANASRMSHAELNESPTLDAGDPAELGRQYAELKRRLPQLNVMGGCCGTDHRHVEQIAAACAPLF